MGLLEELEELCLRICAEVKGGPMRSAREGVGALVEAEGALPHLVVLGARGGLRPVAVLLARGGLLPTGGAIAPASMAQDWPQYCDCWYLGRTWQ